MVQSAAVWRSLQRALAIRTLPESGGSAQRVFVPGDLDLLPLTSDLDIQTRPSEGPNTSSL